MEASEIEKGLGILEKIYKKIKMADPQGKELEIIWPESEVEFSFFLEDPGILRRHIGSKIHFPFPEIKDITVISLPIPKVLKTIAKRKDWGWILDLGELGSADGILVRMRYAATSEALYNIAKTWTSSEPMKTREGSEKYWMSAVLIGKEGLSRAFDAVTIREIDVGIRVNIAKCIRLNIPKEFISKLETIQRFIEARDRESLTKIAIERARQVHSIGFKEERERLGELGSFCEPDAFREFIEIVKPFVYSNVTPGEDYFGRFMFPTFPKYMVVRAFTNLSFDNPTVEGHLIFRRGIFEKKVGEIFGR